MYDDAYCSPVAGDGRFPLFVGEAARDGGKRVSASLEPIGKGVRPLAG
jgi:hypothetical protein